MADDLACAAGLGDGGGQDVQVVVEQDQIGAVAGDIGACCDGGGYVGLGEDGGVVDAVADHQDFSALFLQVFNVGEFVFGRGFGAVGVQTELLRDLCDGICAVAAE